MRAKLAFSLVLAVLMLSVCATSIALANPLDHPGWQEEVNIDIKEVRLARLLEGVVVPTGVEYVIDPDIEQWNVPAFTAIRCTREKAFASLLKSCGLTYKVEGEKIIVIPKEGKKSPWLTHVSLSLKETTLGVAVEALCRGMGINYSVDPSVANVVIARLECRDTPFYMALETLLQGTGAISREAGGVVSIIPKPQPGSRASADTGQIDVSVEPGTGDPWARRTNIEVKNARLTTVVEKLLLGKGVNFAISEDAGHLAVRALKMNGVTLRQAFDAVIKEAGAQYLDGSGVLKIQAKKAAGDPKDLICLNLKEIPLPDVLERLFKGVGLNYVVESDASGLRVTASLENVPFQSVIRTLLSSVGMDYRIDGGVYHIYATSPVPANPVAKVPAGDKHTAQVSLKETTADYIMQVLGFGMDGRPVNTQKSAAHLPNVNLGGSVPPKSALEALEGIESIKPGKSESTLVITGNKDDVDCLESLITDVLDTEPRAVQLEVEFYEADAKISADLEALRKLQEEGQLARAKEAARELKAKLSGAGANLLNRSTSSLLNRMRDEITVHTCSSQSDTGKAIITKLVLSVAPVVNQDETITIAMALSLYPGWEWNANTGTYNMALQSLSTNRRMASGEPIVLGGFLRRPGKLGVVLLTGTVLKDSI